MWQPAPGLLPAKSVIRLTERFPTINNPQDLENLLQAIAETVPVESLEGVYQGDHWQIIGKRARILTDISFTATTRSFNQALQNATFNYLSSADSSEMRSRITEIVRSLLLRSGYARARVRLSTEDHDTTVSYHFDIREGIPCQIQRIDLPFTLPANRHLNIKNGDLCDQETIKEALASLEEELRQDGFSQAQLDFQDFEYLDGGKRAYLITKGNLGKIVDYAINDPSRTISFQDLFQRDELSSLDPSVVGPETMVSEIEKKYRQRGYDEVQVRGPEMKTSGPYKVSYHFEVTPGPQYFLRDVQFEGAEHLQKDELLEIMNLKGIWQNNPPFNLDDIRKGQDAIKARYNKDGYWDVQVRDPRPAKDRNSNSVQVAIHITEGLPRIFRSIRFDGAKEITAEELSELWQVKEGEPFDRAKLVELESAIRKLYFERGHLYVTSTANFVTTNLRKALWTDIVVSITEGPRVKIGDIRVVGLVKTDPKVVLRELRFSSGEYYDPEKIEDSRRAISSLGLFRSVQIFPSDRAALAESNPELDLTLEVRETRPGNVSFGPGWSLSDGWRYNVDVSYNNILGDGRQILTHGGFDEQVHQKAIGAKTMVGRRFSIGYLEPYLGDYPVDGTVSISHRAQAEEFWTLNYEGELGLTHRFRSLLPSSSITLYHGRKVTREEGREAQKLSLVSTGNIRVGRIGTRFFLDRRNDIAWPTKGYTVGADLSWARYNFGGDLRYFRWEVSHNRYFQLWPNYVFAIGASLAAYEDVSRNTDDEDRDVLPASERLKAGGADTVRGFRPRSLGPIARYQDDGEDGSTPGSITQDYIGGSRRTVVKAELRHLFSEHFAGTYFVDSGNVFFSPAEMEKFRSLYDSTGDPDNAATKPSIEDNIGYDFEDLVRDPAILYNKHYVASGIALNYLTALGSINLAYGIPIHEPKTQRCIDYPDRLCFKRGSENDVWLFRGQFDINVGASF